MLLILGVMLALAIPRLGNRSYAQLNSETRKLALAFRYLRHAAILNGRPYRLMYDLDNRSYWVMVGDVDTPPPPDEEEEEESGFDDTDLFADATPVESFSHDVDGPIGTRKLPESIGYSDVELPQVAGKVSEGIAYTTFYPDGYVDISVIHLDNGQDVFTLYVLNPITGQVFVEPGYLSWEG